MTDLPARIRLAVIGAPGHESALWEHRCGHVETWPLDDEYVAAEGEIHDQGCDACDSAPYPGAWRPLYAPDWPGDTPAAARPAPGREERLADLADIVQAHTSGYRHGGAAHLADVLLTYMTDRRRPDCAAAPAPKGPTVQGAVTRPDG